MYDEKRHYLRDRGLDDAKVACQGCGHDARKTTTITDSEVGCRRSVKRNTRRSAERLDPKIALDLGVIIQLYLVAMKCSATSVRREAIELLLNYPRWEELWDSLCQGISPNGLWMLNPYMRAN